MYFVTNSKLRLYVIRRSHPWQVAESIENKEICDWFLSIWHNLQQYCKLICLSKSTTTVKCIKMYLGKYFHIREILRSQNRYWNYKFYSTISWICPFQLKICFLPTFKPCSTHISRRKAYSNFNFFIFKYANLLFSSIFCTCSSLT